MRITHTVFQCVVNHTRQSRQVEVRDLFCSLFLGDRFALTPQPYLRDWS
jgi:hypothetical protein